LALFVAVVVVQFLPELGVEELDLVGLVLVEAIRSQ
jgi:hypothetical protein